ncbi:hypothetical protein, partial [Bacillus sp. OTU2372]|uniref:hypothetical protein n=1 Tax=Bacillus sp. OTU2372 TaxID=3043858 RepID=UPI00313A9F6E
WEFFGPIAIASKRNDSNFWRNPTGFLKQAGSQHGQLYQQKCQLSTLLINLRTVYDVSTSEMRTKLDQVEAYCLSIVATEQLGYFILAAMESPRLG